MKLILLPFLMFTSVLLFGQAREEWEGIEQWEEEGAKANLGIGLGLDYGGIGARISGLPTPKIALFAGVGYNFVGTGFNFGGLFRLAPNKRVCPFFGAMYGYNAAIIIEGLKEANKSFYGPSFGGGVEFKKRKNNNFFNLEMWLPVRSQKFEDHFNALKRNPAIQIERPLPITISVGYHFALDGNF